MPATPLNPAASAARARSTSCSMVSRICGRKTQNSSGLLTGNSSLRPHPGHSQSQLRSRRTQPSFEDVVRLRKLALGDVEAPGRQCRTELNEHGSEVDLDGERMVSTGTGHDRDDGDAEEISRAEPV